MFTGLCHERQLEVDFDHQLSPFDASHTTLTHKESLTRRCHTPDDRRPYVPGRNRTATDTYAGISRAGDGPGAGDAGAEEEDTIAHPFANSRSLAIAIPEDGIDVEAEAMMYKRSLQCCRFVHFGMLFLPGATLEG